MAINMERQTTPVSFIEPQLRQRSLNVENLQIAAAGSPNKRANGEPIQSERKKRRRTQQLKGSQMPVDRAPEK